MTSGDIAIVGMACRFAGDAKSPEEFHEMLQKGKDAWTKIPKDRFKAESFKHPSNDLSGTMVCEGGYFLDQDVSQWDAPFFTCSASEARSYDPQQRLLLEVAYESLESAGIPIESIANTDAACFVGAFSEDYKSISSRDIHAAPKYAKTGTALSILSNRISWFYNLHGPSVTCDTACSSSMAALHLACETIRSDTNPTRCALVGGANLILDPDDQCGLNALGFFSPDSRCFSLDARANGYARGEGLGMLVLKHIDDAIRDRDPIRAVIRGTGLNSDGKTAGITLPSAEAQARLIVNTYKMANLDPADTQYVELHGTGTKAGDNAEVRAISSTIAAKGRKQPLYCGSVKSRVGHTEAAAGMAAIIKCVLCLEKGVITPNLNFASANPRLRLDASGITVPTSTVPWPECEVRRCSINNFGFGGTNAHAVIDDAFNYLRLRGGKEKEKEEKNLQRADEMEPSLLLQRRRQPRVFVLSAPEQAATTRQRRAHADYIESSRGPESRLRRLAKTLGGNRSVFQWRHAVVASSAQELLTSWRDDTIKPAKAAGSSPMVAFVFTGQGAQWYGMGRELLCFPEFARSVRLSAELLTTGLGCAWDAWTELTQPTCAGDSKVNQAEYSQPLCLVLQIALVDLLAHWGIRPTSAVGHSSGEIAAAYAAGALSRSDCLKIAYHRGVVSKLAQVRKPGGCMMAVGKSAEAVGAVLASSSSSSSSSGSSGSGKGVGVVIACINSPESVTLSGDKSALEELKVHFDEEKIFCRILQVDNAYHSPQMQSVSADYLEAIASISPLAAANSVSFYSTVRGQKIPTSDLTAEYWVENLCSPVRFVEALDDMIYAAGVDKHNQAKAKADAPSMLLEIGPHSALAGPIKQFKANRHALEHVAYLSMLVRDKDASTTAVSAAANLWTSGVAVKLDKVNDVDETVETLTDLPNYPWNHSTSYWHETRQSRNHRQPEFARHDLIGARIDSYNPMEPVWKNYLKVSNLPWLQDHQIQGDIVFPAAGMICSAVEAARQIAATESSGEEDLSGFELRELSVARALVIPDNETGIEVHVNLKRRKTGMGSGVGAWFEFSYYSCQDNDTFVEHAAGLLQIQYRRKESEVDQGREAREETLSQNRRWESKRAMCLEKVARSSHYNFCKEQGLLFGKTFQGLRGAHQNGLTVAFDVGIVDTRACMPAYHESDYIIHPATLDAVFQAMMIAVPRMEGVEKQVWVPTGAASMVISSDITRTHGAILQGLAESSMTGVREMVASVLVKDTQDQQSAPALIIDSFRFTGLGPTQRSTQSSDVLASKLYSAPVWKPDVDLIDAQTLRAMSGVMGDASGMSRYCSMADSLLKEICKSGLSHLTPIISASLPPHLLKLADWMHRQYSHQQTGLVIPVDSPDISQGVVKLPDLADLSGIQSFKELYPIDGQLALHVYRALGAIFSEQTTPIATLRQDDLLNKAYQEVYGLQIHVELMKTWFELKAHKQPALRVLEIGAGTASTTLPVLQHLSRTGSDTPMFSSWTFTDISAGWFESARDLLADWKGRVEYKVLDIDVDPLEQGFEAGSYDVVLAVNVLHATKNIGTTLHHCNTLLKPGGKLVLGEYTNPSDLANFVFGIMPGWWAAEDDRKAGPLLLQSQWHESLLSAGFSGADMSIADNDDPVAHRMSTIISTKPRQLPSRSMTIVIPQVCGDPTKKLAAEICRQLQQKHGHEGVVMTLAAAALEAKHKSVVSLLDYEAPFFAETSKTDFEHVQTLLLQSDELLWVTRSEPHETPSHPMKRMVSGLIRCIKTEDSSRSLYELHLSRPLAEDVESTSAAVCKRLQTIWQAAGDDGAEEMETEEKGGSFCIPRHMPCRAMNDSLARAAQVVAPRAELGALVQENRPLKLNIAHPGMLDTLRFVDDERALEPLEEFEVEIEVRACALNFLDIMIAMGQIQRQVLGHEACRTVSRVGSKVSEVSCGDRVVFVGPGSMRTHIRAHESVVQKVPDRLSFSEAVSIPIAYATAYRSLVEVARLEKGESVLIHAAAGGLGQALIQIAKLLEAEIYCTVGSSEKKETVVSLGVKPERVFSSRDLSFAKGVKRVTDGRGVDVVVNSLAGEALRQSWNCLAPYGRFIEVGKKDILGNSGLEMQQFVNNTVFAGVNLEAMMIDQPVRCRKVVAKVFKLFEDGLVDFIKPIVVRDFTEVESVFRDMQRGAHIGKLVLEVTPSSRVPILPRAEVPLSLDADATYLLVGGLGGLGRAQAVYLADNGARHIAFISRSGDAKPEAKKLLDSLNASGVEAKSYAGDVASVDDMRLILDDISLTMPPVRGVIQGAMVLADSLFHRMSHEQWEAATRPKVQGTWNLHELLPKDLDFFIVLSSLAGIIGSVSQANYAAGNTFQDALVHYRRSKGLAAQSLDIGVMTGIGYVEEHDDARARTSQLRVTSLGEKQFMHTLRIAMAGSVDGNEAPMPQLLVGAGSGGIQQLVKEEDESADFYWLRLLPAFSYLQQMDIQGQDDSESSEGQDEAGKLVAELKLCKTTDEANDVAQRLLVSRIAKHISIDPNDISTDKPIHAYGVDSLVAVELRNWLSLELKSELTIFDLTGSDPISEVSKKIANRSKLVTDVKTSA